MSEQLLITGNAIPDDKTAEWTQRKPIRHFRYTIRQSTNGNIDKHGLPQHSLVLFKTERTPTPAPMASDLADMASFVKSMATAVGSSWTSAQSLGVALDTQSWLIFELADDVNWRFSGSRPAVTTKKADPGYKDSTTGAKRPHSNANLRYVFVDDKGGVTVESDPAKGPANVDCRMVFFQVVGRAKDERQGMNLIVEFFQDRQDGIANRFIPIIIDPDVPESGQQGFP